MTLRQFIAAILLTASYEVPPPEFDRYFAARRILGQCMRG